MMTETQKRSPLDEKLEFVYGAEQAKTLKAAIEQLLIEKRDSLPKKSGKTEFVTEKDAILITYGDTILETGKPPLKNLHEFLQKHVGSTLSGVHLLPFYPYSSDDGFSVIDYFRVNPELGSWEDIEALSHDYSLMFDAVINHISAKSEWFQEYLKGNPDYRDYFIEADPEADYSRVTRPRALPLLTQFETADGPKYIWTTFSEDQIDLNYANPDVVLKLLELLLFYISKGAKLIRLDAIGFIWKEMGTSCIHHDKAHAIIQVFREVLDEVAPDTVIITETNVPHKDNISYFGNGFNEARMVYQFPLPPLTLHTFLTGNAEKLSGWAEKLEPTTKETAFFNFLASHDGIGVRPAEGILSSGEIEELIRAVETRGGYVSYKDNGDGSKSPYELNINYFDALAAPGEEAAVSVRRFLAAQSVLLSVAGVPGIYLHSLLGSRNDQKGVEATGRYRSINREKLDRQEVETELSDPSSVRHLVFTQMKEMIAKRTREKAFHPNSRQEILRLNSQVLSFIRTHEPSGEQIAVLINVSGDRQKLTLKLPVRSAVDLISESAVTSETNTFSVALEPYQVMWLKAEGLQR